MKRNRCASSCGIGARVGAECALTASKPKKTIQAGINIALDGDTVRLANGTYSGPGNRELRIEKAITITSAGAASKCVINGDALTVFTVGSVGRGTVSLNAVTVKNAEYGIYSWEEGDFSEPPKIKVTNCVFAGPGEAGIWIRAFGEGPEIDNCRFIGQSTGIALAARDAFVTRCSFEFNLTGLWLWDSFQPVVDECEFVGCREGLYIAFTTIAYVTSNSFVGNYWGIGGQDSTSLQINACSFYANERGAYMYGGRDYITQGTFAENVIAVELGAGEFQFDSCVFKDNLDSGAFVDMDSYSEFKSCQFTRNNYAGLQASSYNRVRALGCAFLGNGYYGVIASPNQTDLTLHSCTFVGNGWEGGAAIALQSFEDSGSEVTVTNCTMTRNSFGILFEQDPFSPGPAPAVTNCILRSNSVDLWGTAATYSDVGTGVTAGLGNINSDPKFIVNPSPGVDTVWGTFDDNYGNLLIQMTSPCFNKGSAAAPGLPDVDFAGGKRVVAGKPDMGAYERQPTITSIVPSSALKGRTTPLVVTVNGTLLEPGAKVYFNGSARPTTFFSSTKVTVTLTASDFNIKGSFPIRVVNPGGDQTNAATFKVN